MTRERWAPVTTHFGFYEVSDRGRVRSICRIGKPAKILKHSKGGRNEAYHRVMLEAGPKRRHAYVHVLVLEAFVGPRREGTKACHINDDQSNNRLANLYWGTAEENYMDRAFNAERKAGAYDHLEAAPF